MGMDGNYFLLKFLLRNLKFRSSLKVFEGMDTEVIWPLMMSRSYLAPARRKVGWCILSYSFIDLHIVCTFGLVTF